MTNAVEILLYTLQPKTGDEFHTIMQTVSVRLHQSIGMDVVSFRKSAHGSDAYYLIRAFTDLGHLESSQRRSMSAKLGELGRAQTLSPASRPS